MIRTVLAPACLLILACAHPAPAGPGKLVIVGGALSEGNDAVHGAFIDATAARGGAGAILIVPAASASPAAGAARFRAQLARRGVSEERIHVLPLAVLDDDSTPDVDESSWAANGDDPELAARARAASGFWFVGGDQSRTAAVLLDTAGGDRAVMAAIREAHAAGAAIGGTSAGAAIMSDPMLVGGDSLGALRHGVVRASSARPNQESGVVEIARGLGFFPHGIVDQHFDAKARHARLLAALAHLQVRRGYGIDEDTALVVDLAAGTGTVAGRGGVTIIEIGEAEFAGPDRPFSCRNARVHLLSAGDAVRLPGGVVEPGPGRRPTAGREYNRIGEVVQGGVLGSYGAFREFATQLLVDNSELAEASSLVAGSGPDGWRVRLFKDARTQGWWLSGTTYTVTDLGMDIEPVRIAVDPR